MSFSGSFSLDQGIIFLLLMALTAGVCQIAWGTYTHGQAFSRPPGKPRSDYLRLWQQLLKWQVVPPSYTAPPELEEFACARDFIQSSAIIGGGLAIVLASIGSAAIALATTGSLVILFAGTGLFFGATLLFVSLVGYSLGYGSGVWRLHRLTTSRGAYADLKPRRLAEYRSALFPWIAGALIAYTLLIPLLVAPYLGAQIPFSPAGLLAPTWILEAVPAAMLVALVTGEVVMARIARLPRVLLLANPHTARRADTLLRAMTIARVQGLVFAAIGYLGVAQGFILQQYLGHLSVTSQGWAPYAILFTPALVFPWVIGLIGLSLPMLSGRIGGTVSGWPGRPVRTP